MKEKKWKSKETEEKKTKEKKAHMKARRRTGQRRFPGVPVVVADWWDTEEEMTKNMQSKL